MYKISRRQFLAISTALVALPQSAIAGGDATMLTGQSLLGENADWQAQDFEDSQGIKSVSFNVKKRRLTLDTDLIGKDKNFSKGEVYLDFRYFPGLEDKDGIDLRLNKITVLAKVPSEFVVPEPNRNGIQVFVKDNNFRVQYGSWKNVTKAGKIKATLTPTTSDIPDGHTTPGFDPSKIRLVGIKFATGDKSLATYDGPLYVTGIEIVPPLTISAPPNLPSSIPPPTFSSGDRIEIRSNSFFLNDRKWFIVGGNWRVIDYAQNFGTLSWFPQGNGVSKHPNFIRANLDYMRRAGIKVIRIGLLEDGRVLFDKDGRVTGYGDIFRKDFALFLDLAAQVGIKVEVVLFDFHLAGKGMEDNRVFLRGRSNIITDPELRVEFKNEFLIPFLREFASHETFFSVDIINEPEWIISKQEKGAWDDVKDLEKRAEMPLPRAVLNSFINECISTIRANAPGKIVTVGSSSQFIPLVNDLEIDYYALHHYPWMSPLSQNLLLIQQDKPWLLEEYPTRVKQGDPIGTAPDRIADWLDLTLSEGGAGALLWNLSPQSDEYSFTFMERESKLLELRDWVSLHSQDIF